MRTHALALMVGSLATGCCFAGLSGAGTDAAPVEPLVEPALVRSGAADEPDVDAVSVAPPSASPVLAPERASVSAMIVDRAPIARGAAELFASARPHEGPIERGMLVCRAQVHGGGFDDSFFAGGADVGLLARFGDGVVRATGQTAERIYTFPIARLEPSDTVWIRVLDRDLLFHDTIGEGSISFERAPMTIGMGQATVECRAVASELVEQRAGEAIAGLRRAVDRLDDVTPDLAADDLGYPHDRILAIAESASRAGAWVEWSDAPLAAQIERADGFEGEWSRRVRAAIDDALRVLPGPGSALVLGHGERVRIADTLCGAAALSLRQDVGDAIAPGASGACVVLLEIESIAGPITLAPASTPEGTPSPPYLDVSALDRDGAATPGSIVARRAGGAWIRPSDPIALERGGRAELVLALGGERATLLRVRHGNGAFAVMRAQ